MDIAISTLQQIRTYIGMGPLMEILCMQTIPNNYAYVLTLIPAWISNQMPSKVWDEITYPFLNKLHRLHVEVYEWINNFISHFIMDVIIYACWD